MQPTLQVQILQLFQALPTHFRIGVNFNFAALIQDFETDFHVGLRNQTWRFSRPFDEKNVVPIKLIAESGCFPFILIVKTVQIKVTQV